MLVLELGRKERIDHLAFAPDGRGLAAASETGVALWREIAEGRRAERLPGPYYVTDVRFTADGRWLFAASGRELRRLDPATGAHAASSLWGGHNVRFDVSPVAPLVLVVQSLLGNGGRLALWRADDLSPAGKVWERESPIGPVHRPHFLPGGDRFARVEGAWVAARARSEFHVVTYDTATGAPLARSRTITQWMYETQLSADGRWIATRSTNTIDLWPIAGEVPTVCVRNDSRRHFTGAAFHPSSRYLLATSNDHTAKLYDTATWDEVRTLTWQVGRMRSACFSPDGALAAAGSDKGQVVVWDVDV